MLDDGRSLPQFDNHYSNYTLVDSWLDSRCGHDEHGKRLPFTLSGANEKDHRRNVQLWHQTQSTYNEAFHRPEGLQSGVASDMIRPQELPRELILASGEDLQLRGIPTSYDYGAHYGVPGGVLGESSSISASGGTSERVKVIRAGGVVSEAPPLDEAEQRRLKLLRASTAAAHQPPDKSTLYDVHSPHILPAFSEDNEGPVARRGPLPTFGDLAGQKEALPRKTVLPDYQTWDKMLSVHRKADIPVEHYFFQRSIPPPCVPK